MLTLLMANWWACSFLPSIKFSVMMVSREDGGLTIAIMSF
jgi:hypothetical protein